MDHKAHIVSIYVLGNHLLQVSLCEKFDAVCGSLVHTGDSISNETELEVAMSKSLPLLLGDKTD